MGPIAAWLSDQEPQSPQITSTVLRYWNMARQRYQHRFRRSGRAPARLCRPHRQPSRAYPREMCGSSPATAAALRDSDCPLEGDGFEPSVPHTKQPFSLPRSVPQFAFRDKNRLFRARDRWFESISLQRGVRCEPRAPGRRSALGVSRGASTGPVLRDRIVIAPADCTQRGLGKGRFRGSGSE